MPNELRVVPIKLPLANAYLVLDERPILVDTGYSGDEGRILKALAAQGLTPRDLALILITHAHGDHIGSAAALRKLSGAPIALHRADEAAATSGRNGPLTPTRATASLMALIFGRLMRPVEPAPPDLLVEEGHDLRAYGVRGALLHTPGHTAGSLSLRLAGGQMLIGDLLMGGHLGGALGPTRPRYHYFAESLATVRASLARVLAHSPTRLYVGHGGPLPGAAVRALASDKGLAATAAR